MRRYLLSLTGVILAAAVLVPTAQAAIVDFDSIVAPGFYDQVTPGGPQGPHLVFPGVTFDGGVVLSNDGWADLATSAPNVYGTSDFLPLNDGSFLPGSITAVFGTPVTSVGLDVINGYPDGANVTLTAFDAGHAVLGSIVVGLDAFSLPGAVGSVSLSGLGLIYSIEVTSDQDTGSIDFAIDTVEFEPIPEPGTLVLIGTGLATMLARRRRRG